MISRRNRSLTTCSNGMAEKECLENLPKSAIFSGEMCENLRVFAKNRAVAALRQTFARRRKTAWKWLFLHQAERMNQAEAGVKCDNFGVRMVELGYSEHMYIKLRMPYPRG